MKSDINWKTEYYVEEKDWTISCVYNPQLKDKKWSTYITVSTDKVFHFICDVFTHKGIKFFITKNRKRVIFLEVASVPDTDDYIGGTLPEVYENLMMTIRESLHEILDTKQTKPRRN